jgi:hypothetical protein
MCARPLTLSFALMLVTVVAGLVVRFAPLGLSPFVVKYGGSTLWALMIYWIASTVLPKWRIPAVALLAGILGTAIEFGKLYHSPALDAFRLTLPGIVLLGRFFSVWDILVYWLAVLVGAVVDWRLRPRLTSTISRQPVRGGYGRRRERRGGVRLPRRRSCR